MIKKKVFDGIKNINMRLFTTTQAQRDALLEQLPSNLSRSNVAELRNALKFAGIRPPNGRAVSSLDAEGVRRLVQNSLNPPQAQVRDPATPAPQGAPAPQGPPAGIPLAPPAPQDDNDGQGPSAPPAPQTPAGFTPQQIQALRDVASSKKGRVRKTDKKANELRKIIRDSGVKGVRGKSRDDLIDSAKEKLEALEGAEPVARQVRFDVPPPPQQPAGLPPPQGAPRTPFQSPETPDQRQQGALSGFPQSIIDGVSSTLGYFNTPAGQPVGQPAGQPQPLKSRIPTLRPSDEDGQGKGQGTDSDESNDEGEGQGKGYSVRRRATQAKKERDEMARDGAIVEQAKQQEAERRAQEAKAEREEAKRDEETSKIVRPAPSTEGTLDPAGTAAPEPEAEAPPQTPEQLAKQIGAKLKGIRKGDEIRDKLISNGVIPAEIDGKEANTNQLKYIVRRLKAGLLEPSMSRQALDGLLSRANKSGNDARIATDYLQDRGFDKKGNSLWSYQAPPKTTGSGQNPYDMLMKAINLIIDQKMNKQSGGGCMCSKKMKGGQIKQEYFTVAGGNKTNIHDKVKQILYGHFEKLRLLK